MRRLVSLSVAGAVLMAAASWSAGAVPMAWTPVLRPLAMVASYLGLAGVVGTWLVIGHRLLVRREPAAAAPIARYAALTAAPLLLAAPFGRDLWAYAAQGHLTGRGLDPYTAGPADAPGPFSAEVSARWLHTPAPYGPVWLRVSQAAAWASHGHPTVAALLLRLPAYAGLLLCCWAVPRLADRLGGSAAIALWLGAADPLMTVLGVGGGHNDLVMMGLALAGLVIAARPGLPALAAGAALGGVAVLIKSPAAVVVAFTVPVWLWLRRPDARDALARGLTAVLTAAGAAVATVAALTAATGLGFGWTRQVNSDAQWVSWLSLPSAVAMTGKWVTGADHPRSLDDTVRACRTVGEVVAVVALIVLWGWAVRGALAGSRPRPLPVLAAALGLAALLGPSVQPWYYLWGLLLAGAVVRRPAALALLAAVPLMFVAMITPTGTGLESSWPAPLIAAAAVAVALRTLVARPEPARRDQSRASAL